MSDNYHFTEDEKLLLESVFTYNQWPSIEKLQQLAKKLAVTEKKIRKWFNNKRYRVKKERTQTISSQCKHFTTKLDFSCVHDHSVFTYDDDLSCNTD